MADILLTKVISADGTAEFQWKSKDDEVTPATKEITLSFAECEQMKKALDEVTELNKKTGMKDYHFKMAS